MSGDEKFLLWATFGLALANFIVTLKIARGLEDAKKSVDGIIGAGTGIGDALHSLGWG